MEVGDRALISLNLKEFNRDESPVITNPMLRYAGQEVTIKEKLQSPYLPYSVYIVKENAYLWSEKWITCIDDMKNIEIKELDVVSILKEGE